MLNVCIHPSFYFIQSSELWMSCSLLSWQTNMFALPFTPTSNLPNLHVFWLWEETGASGGKPTQCVCVCVCHQHLNTNTNWQCRGQICSTQSIGTWRLHHEVLHWIVDCSFFVQVVKDYTNNKECSVQRSTISICYFENNDHNWQRQCVAAHRALKCLEIDISSLLMIIHQKLLSQYTTSFCTSIQSHLTMLNSGDSM